MIEKLFKEKEWNFATGSLSSNTWHPSVLFNANKFHRSSCVFLLLFFIIIIIMCRVVSLCRCSICLIYQFWLTQPVRDIISHLNPPPSTHPPLSLSLSSPNVCSIVIALHTYAYSSFIEKQWPNPANGTVSGYMEWQWMGATGYGHFMPYWIAQHTTHNRHTNIDNLPGARGYCPWDAHVCSVFHRTTICVCALPQLPINPRSAERPKHPDFDQIPKCNEAIIDTNDARKISRGAGWNLKKLKKKTAAAPPSVN